MTYFANITKRKVFYPPPVLKFVKNIMHIFPLCEADTNVVKVFKVLRGH